MMELWFYLSFMFWVILEGFVVWLFMGLLLFVIFGEVLLRFLNLVRVGRIEGFFYYFWLVLVLIRCNFILKNNVVFYIFLRCGVFLFVT